MSLIIYKRSFSVVQKLRRDTSYIVATYFEDLFIILGRLFLFSLFYYLFSYYLEALLKAKGSVLM